MAKVLKIIDKISYRVGTAFMVTLPLLAVVVVYEVVARYVFNSPTKWAFETSMFLYGILALMGGGYVLLHNAHIKIDVLYVRFSERVRAIVDLITSPYFLAFMFMFIWVGQRYLLRSWRIGEVSDSFWAPPLWPLRLAFVLGASIHLLQGIAKIIRDCRTATRRTTQEQK